MQYGEKELGDLYRFKPQLPLPPASERGQQWNPRCIRSGRTAVLYVWCTTDTRDGIPTRLKHRFIFEANPLIKLSGDARADKLTA